MQRERNQGSLKRGLSGRGFIRSAKLKACFSLISNKNKIMARTSRPIDPTSEISKPTTEALFPVRREEAIKSEASMTSGLK